MPRTLGPSGAIDGHVHLEMPFSGTIQPTATKQVHGAACGGTTTVFDFVLQEAKTG